MARVTPKPDAAGPGFWHRQAIYVALAMFAAFADLRLIILWMPKAFLLSAGVADGVVRGEPMWRVYQSRVLGPWLVHALSAFMSPGVAYAWFVFAVLFASGYGVLRFTQELRDRTRPPVLSFLIFHLAILFLMPCLWLYPWDLVSVLTFTVFNFLVLKRARWGWFAALYAVAVFNHEMALVIAGWLVVDALVQLGQKRGRAGARGRGAWAQLWIGAGLLAAGLVVIEALRTTLLVRETQSPQDLPPGVVYGGSFHFSLVQNWRTAVSYWTLSVPDGFAFLVPLFLLMVVVLALLLARAGWSRFGALSVVLLVMVAALLCFGLVFETRVQLPLVPFVAMNAWGAFRRRVVSSAVADG